MGGMGNGLSHYNEKLKSVIRDVVTNWVACGAASHLRLKLAIPMPKLKTCKRRMWSGFSSEIETRGALHQRRMHPGRMWSGFSFEIETYHAPHPISHSPCSHWGAPSPLKLKQPPPHSAHPPA